jgi:hypothetical protein
MVSGELNKPDFGDCGVTAATVVSLEKFNEN